MPRINSKKVRSSKIPIASETKLDMACTREPPPVYCLLPSPDIFYHRPSEVRNLAFDGWRQPFRTLPSYVMPARLITIARLTFGQDSRSASRRKPVTVAAAAAAPPYGVVQYLHRYNARPPRCPPGSRCTQTGRAGLDDMPTPSHLPESWMSSLILPNPTNVVAAHDSSSGGKTHSEHIDASAVSVWDTGGQRTDCSKRAKNTTRIKKTYTHFGL